MIPANCILLGKITKIHGFEGAVTVKTELNLSENIPADEPVFLEIDGRPVPFFVEEINSPKPGIMNLKFEDYDGPERVKELVGCNIFIYGRPSDDKKNEDISSLIGFIVSSANGETAGIIDEIIQNPGQILLVVISANGKKLLFPFHEDLIIEINNDLKIITMDIPEGLTEIN